MTIRVLFVCLGNICRSPMAEGVFTNLVHEAGLADRFEIDSAGTSSWHAGETPHPGTSRVLVGHDIPYSGRSRTMDQSDLSDKETYIIAMDQSNLRQIRSNFGDHPRLYRLLDFATQSDIQDVPDPYYNDNFEFVYKLVTDGCRGLLDTIRIQEKI
jgi:protein-tyrosine phosphatase